MTRRRRASVLIEFAMAAAGLIAIAFVVTRVGVWLNRSMQARNDSYQAQRVPAGSTEPGAGPTRFNAPGGIHLIGGTAESTGGLPPQAASTYDTSCSNASLTQAAQKRADVLTALGVTVPILQYSVAVLHSRALQLLQQANALARDAARIAEILNDINTRIDPRLADIHDLDVVQGDGDHVIDFGDWRDEFLQTDCDGFGGFPGLDSNPQVYGGLHNIDERWTSIYCQLDQSKEHSVGWTIWQLERLVLTLIQLDPNWPGSTAWQLEADNVGSAAWHLDPTNTGSTAQLLEQARDACDNTVLANQATGDPWKVTACYGHDIGAHAGAPHGGMDFGALAGTSIQAYEDGIVVTAFTGMDVSCISDESLCPAGSPERYGNHVLVFHPASNTYTMYAHMTDVSVTANQPINAGDSIGTVGNTGFSDGAHLHFELRNSSSTPIDPLGGSCCDTDGFGQCTILPVSTSASLGESSGTCNSAEKSRLEGLLANYQTALGNYQTDLATYETQKATIEAAVAPFTVDDLDDVRLVRADLIGEQDALGPLVHEVRQLQGDVTVTIGQAQGDGKRKLLNEIDGLLTRNNFGVSWMSLWTELAAQHGFSDDLASNLSEVYWWIVTSWDNENRADRDEPSMTAYLEELLWRLWWLIRQRLDYAQSVQSEFPQQVDDQHQEYFDGSEFWIPDAITGCVRDPNDILVCTGPPDSRARYLELVHLVQVLRDQGNLIRENIIDAEGLEHLGQTECASQDDN